jgi:glycosyltransferase involved in cell wall biosynthesis
VELGRDLGLDVSWARIPKSIFERLFLFCRIKTSDVIVIQQKLLSSFELSILKNRCGKLVYDFDDAMWTLPTKDLVSGKKRRKAARASRRFGVQCAVSDLCIAGNTYLARKASEYQQHIRIIPTGLDTDKYVPRRDAEEDGPVRVGWMGTSGNLAYVQEPLRHLEGCDGRVRFSVVSDAPYRGPGEGSVEWAAWSDAEEVAQLQAMDIGLMPLADDEYTRGKCGFKILQYMACGAVPVASAVGVNSEIIDHGVDGFLVKGPEDWREHVLNLAEHGELRRRMREAARRKVVARYDLRRVARLVWSALDVEEA